MTALLWAVEVENREIAETLMKHGAKSNKVDKYGRTPHNLAIKKESSDLLHVLEETSPVESSMRRLSNTFALTAPCVGVKVPKIPQTSKTTPLTIEIDSESPSSSTARNDDQQAGKSPPFHGFPKRAHVHSALGRKSLSLTSNLSQKLTTTLHAVFCLVI